MTLHPYLFGGLLTRHGSDSRPAFTGVNWIEVNPVSRGLQRRSLVGIGFAALCLPFWRVGRPQTLATPRPGTTELAHRVVFPLNPPAGARTAPAERCHGEL